MHNFIEVCVTGDLKWLAKTGSPDNLEGAWANIFSEFCEALGGGEVSETLRLATQIHYLSNRVKLVGSAIEGLKLGRHESLIKFLQDEMGIRLTFADLDKDLKRTVSICKSDEAKLAKYVTDYNKLQSGKKPTRGDFSKDLVSLSKHMGYTVSKDKITVAEYVYMINDIKQNGK